MRAANLNTRQISAVIDHAKFGLVSPRTRACKLCGYVSKHIRCKMGGVRPLRQGNICLRCDAVYLTLQVETSDTYRMLDH